jgi:hypothetical protein
MNATIIYCDETTLKKKEYIFNIRIQTRAGIGEAYFNVLLTLKIMQMI